MEVVIMGQGEDLLFCKIKSSEVKIDNLRPAGVIMNPTTIHEISRLGINEREG
jgi:hypothetical protein